VSTFLQLIERPIRTAEDSQMVDFGFFI